MDALAKGGAFHGEHREGTPPRDAEPHRLAPPGRAAPRWLRGVVVAVAVAAMAGAVLAHALVPLLLRDAPLLLLALYPSNAHLVLASPEVAIAPFVAVAVARRLLGDSAAFILGCWYGERAVEWLGRRAGRGRGLVERVEGLFPRLSQPLVFAFASASVSALAGATGMRPRRFLVLKATGTLGAVLAYRLVAGAASGPLAAILRFTERNALWLTAIFVGLTALGLLRERRRGRRDACGGSPAGGGAGDPRPAK